MHFEHEKHYLKAESHYSLSFFLELMYQCETPMVSLRDRLYFNKLFGPCFRKLSLKLEDFSFWKSSFKLVSVDSEAIMLNQQWWHLGEVYTTVYSENANKGKLKIRTHTTTWFSSVCVCILSKITPYYLLGFFPLLTFFFLRK